MTLDEIAANAPFPWRYVTVGTGQVLCLDALNREVPLFVMLDLAVSATHRHLAEQQAAKSSSL